MAKILKFYRAVSVSVSAVSRAVAVTVTVMAILLVLFAMTVSVVVVSITIAMAVRMTTWAVTVSMPSNAKRHSACERLVIAVPIGKGGLPAMFTKTPIAATIVNISASPLSRS